MSLEDFLSEEQKILDKSRASFPEEIQAFNMIKMVAQEAAKSIEEAKASDVNQPFMFLTLFHIIHSDLRLAFILTLRGHYLDSFAILRPAIEMTSHLYNMSKAPQENAIIWLRQKEKGWKNKYGKIYEKNLFPKDNEAMKKLERIYYACCDFGSHATAFKLAYRGAKTKVGNKATYHFYDLNADDIRSRKQLLFILHAGRHIVQIAKEAFSKTLDAKGFEPIKAVCKLTNQQIEKLIEKHKTLRLFDLQPPKFKSKAATQFATSTLIT